MTIDILIKYLMIIDTSSELSIREYGRINDNKANRNGKITFKQHIRIYKSSMNSLNNKEIAAEEKLGKL